MRQRKYASVNAPVLCTNRMSLVRMTGGWTFGSAAGRSFYPLLSYSVPACPGRKFKIDIFYFLEFPDNYCNRWKFALLCVCVEKARPNDGRTITHWRVTPPRKTTYPPAGPKEGTLWRATVRRFGSSRALVSFCGRG